MRLPPLKKGNLLTQEWRLIGATKKRGSAGHPGKRKREVGRPTSPKKADCSEKPTGAPYCQKRALPGGKGGARHRAYRTKSNAWETPANLYSRLVGGDHRGQSCRRLVGMRHDWLFREMRNTEKRSGGNLILRTIGC